MSSSVNTERFVAHLNDLELSTETGYVEARVTNSMPIPIGRTIVANGCFDMLHPGHLSLLGWLDTIAYKRKLRPIVAVNSDSSVKLLKGPHRPMQPQEVRAAVITHLKWPLTVIIFDDDTPERLFNILQPAVILKGSEYDTETVVKWGGAEVMTVPMFDSWSTSKILGDTR